MDKRKSKDKNSKIVDLNRYRKSKNEERRRECDLRHQRHRLVRDLVHDRSADEDDQQAAQQIHKIGGAFDAHRQSVCWRRRGANCHVPSSARHRR